MLCKSGWNTREILYTAISWCPKATVQAALSTVALEYVEANLDPGVAGQYNTQKARAMLLLNIAVLSIVMTAPLCGALMGILGPHLLKEPEHSDADSSVAGDKIVIPAVLEKSTENSE